MAVETQEVELGADDHVVTFYDRDDELCRTVGAFLAGAIELGGGGIAIATEAHRPLIEAELRTAGIDVTDALGNGTLALCDAAETMASFMPGGRIDGDAFGRVIGSVLCDAAKPGGPVRAYGEMVALLWDGGDVPAAIELEERWNALARDYEFCLLCGYRASSVLGQGHGAGARGRSRSRVPPAVIRVARARARRS
jgi:DcmR-like sensory protein